MSLRVINPYYRWIFPWLLDQVSAAVANERSDLLGQAEGVVLEVGSGTGSSFHCYDEKVSRLIALEPDIPVMELARKHLLDLSPMVQERTDLLLADAQAIPLPDNSVDTLVCFLVLCSVPEPEDALAEMRRVLKPSGQLLFFEHVLSDDPAVQRWQHRLNPFWHRCAGGCQLNRETAVLIESAGFQMEEYERYQHHSFPRIVSTLITGKAVSVGRGDRA